MNPKKITSEDCLTCGACCVASPGQGAFCNVTPEDAEKLGKRYVRLNVWQPSMFDRLAHAIDGNQIPWGAIVTKNSTQKAGPLKGAILTTCKALEGSVLHRVKCKVYDKRPEVCHTAVVPGDKACRWLRKRLKDAAAE